MSFTTLVGCGGNSNPETYPVSGVVTQGGSPVEGATVIFSPTTDEGEEAVGKTDASGEYEMTTYQRGDGARPADYKVRVFKHEGSEEAPASETETKADEGGMAQPGPDYVPPKQDNSRSQGPQHLLPPEYASANSTPLEYTVTEGDNAYDIQLDS